jgi:hypothetical protein
MNRRPIVSLGDLIRAFSGLHPTDATARRDIAVLLGVRWEEVDLVAEQRSDTATRPQPQPSRTSSISPTPIAPTAQTELLDVVPTTLTRLEHVSRVPLLAGTEPLARGGTVVVGGPLRDPLLTPIWTRSIVSTAASTDSQDGPPDIERIVDVLAHGHPLRRLPRQSWPTTRRGVQVLIDAGGGMLPFATDQIHLRDQIVRILGDRAEIATFVGSPLRGLDLVLQPYRAPRQGATVLLLTDLGIGRSSAAQERADESEWLRFIAAVRHAGCRPLALVPYRDARRWPPRIARALPIVAWDRGTSASTIRRAMLRARPEAP